MLNANESTSDASHSSLNEADEVSEQSWDILDDHLNRRHWFKQNFIPFTFNEDALITYH